MSANTRRPAHRGQGAAARATGKNSVRVALPLVGTISLPPPQQLAYLGGIAALTALQVLEWPVSMTLAAGHLVATASNNKVVQDFGEALEDA
ncbi:hypothetical protein [Amycolatopsis benzoatilytica]|uniref:hypothetical protein n=1 Tax=Amycolatopsis benzoatilytica TaxID=346045 RepID=UPI0003815F7E|nr:hypothetical protein [Amycolatopsis benzoatilytica]